MYIHVLMLLTYMYIHAHVHAPTRIASRLSLTEHSEPGSGGDNASDGAGVAPAIAGDHLLDPQHTAACLRAAGEGSLMTDPGSVMLPLDRRGRRRGRGGRGGGGRGGEGGVLALELD